MSGILIVLLLNQFKLKRYIPFSYWLVVVMTSVVGTLITDLLVDKLGVSLVTITIVFSIVLSAIFGSWYASEKILAMHSIDTAKRELFYWAAILFTFALGTATGDLFAESFNLGYLQATLIFGAAIALVAASYYYLHMNGVLSFWTAYILTRPLGAATGDLLSQPHDNGGWGFGTVGTSMLFLSIITSLVIYLSLKQKRLVNG